VLTDNLKHDIVFTEREVIKMAKFKTYYYEFEDGYFFYSNGKTDRNEIAWNVKKHGKLLVEKVVG
jgi:hypothetical protein